MAATETCPRCGTPPVPDALDGLCPTCVGRAALSRFPAYDEYTSLAPDRIDSEEVNTRSGSYRLVQELGQGGFGTVWMAEQERPVRRQVALKIVKLGMDTREVITRFEQERQALAMMEHPSIAQVFDVGATQAGRPFFVMELVRGVRITDYCDLASRSTRERLALLIQVCHAVQHAHQKGIIHRDLKPSNILVGLYDGVPLPKVIDFGIAKATQTQRLSDFTFFTQSGHLIGTPLYMSPEQAESGKLDIDTRSDIYSLGVLLYELLVGRTPLDPERMAGGSPEEIRRIIRDYDPPAPSALFAALDRGQQLSTAHLRKTEPGKLARQLRGDLDLIVAKALAKDRTRRYATANALALDIQRHLDSEPVLARPPEALYRFRRTVKRNQLSFAMGAVITAALLLSVSVLAISNARIARERNERDLALLERSAALTDAKEQLFLALLSRARAGRFSRQMGQRFESLQALTAAAQIRPDDRLRDEAIAAMALPDVRPGPSWGPDRPEAVDGLRQLSATWDERSIIIRRLPDGQEVQRIEAARPTRLVSFSADGRFLAQHDVDGKLHVWRVSDRMPALADAVDECACWEFSSDSRYLAVGRANAVLRIDLLSGQEVNRWSAIGKVHSLAHHPVQPHIAVGYESSTVVRIFDATGMPRHELPVGPGDWQVMAWHPDGKRLAVSGSNPQIQIWDVSRRWLTATLQGHVQQVTSLAFHPSGTLLLSSGWEATFRLWEPSTGRQVLQFRKPMTACSFSTDGRWAGVYTTEGRGQLLEVATCPEYRTYGGASGDYIDGGVSPDGRILSLGMNDGVHLWDLRTGNEVLVETVGKVASAFFQRDGLELFTCGDAGLHRWKVEAGGDASKPIRLTLPQKIPLPFVPLRACRSPDSRLLAVTSESGGGALILDAETGEARSAMLAHPSAGFVALSPDGKWLATAGWRSPLIKLWNVHAGTLVHQWQNEAVASITFTPDSRTLVVMRPDDCSFRDVVTLKTTRRIPREGSLYNTEIAFSPDGKLMALEITPGEVSFMELETGRTVAKLTDPFVDRATWMSFTPDGTQLVTVSNYAKNIHVWDLRRIRQRLKQMRLDWDWPEFLSPSESL